MRLIFLDSETTGLNPNIHEVWEVGCIVRDEGAEDIEHHWFLPLFSFQDADPFALDIGKFWERYPVDKVREQVQDMPEWCRQFMMLTHGAYIVGAVPNFDTDRLARLCRRYGYPLLNHYHLIDVEALAAGHLHMAPPWKSDTVFQLLGIDTDSVEYKEGKHTALGDAKVVRDVYDKILGS